MHIRFGFEITVSCGAPVPMLMALSTHTEFAGRLIGSDHVRSNQSAPITRYVDGYGNNISRTVAAPGLTTFWSDCVAEVDGNPDIIPYNEPQLLIENLPHQTLNFLTASRYCDSDRLVNFAWANFGATREGWDRVNAICTYVHNHVTFGYKFGRPDKTARDVLEEKTGVCRDFAHLGVSLCRAMNIPARYASGYLGDIGVPDTGFDDFCAWFEVFLGDRWYTIDARYNAPRIGRILMVRGSDASDVAMITSFGAYELTSFRVWTSEIGGQASDQQILAMLETLPPPRAAGPDFGTAVPGAVHLI